MHESSDELHGMHGMVPTPMAGEPLERGLPVQACERDVAASLARVSRSLATALGPTPGEPDRFGDPSVQVRRPTPPPLSDRESARRARDAQELADRHAALEATREHPRRS